MRAERVAAHVVGGAGADGVQSAAGCVEAPFNYAVREGEQGQIEQVTLPVYDARVGTEMDLERDGVTLRRVPSQVMDFYDWEEVERVYYPEVEELLKNELGCSRVLPFDHILRNGARLEEEKKVTGTQSGTTRFLSPPVPSVHNDYTVRSGFTRTRQLLEPYMNSDEIDRALEGRIAFINVWRPMSTVERDPLAFLPWDTVDPDDVQTVQFVYTHRLGEVYRVFHSDRHRWVYWPKMQRDEALLFKTFDSAESGVARHALHSAFTLGDGDAPARESIEVRCACFFDDSAINLAPTFRAPHLTPSPDSDSRESLKERRYVPKVPGEW